VALAGWLNTAWMLKCSPELAAFRRATRHVARTQAEILAAILRQNRHTEFGTAHGFADIDGPRQFQARVPLATAESLAGPIQRIAAGAANVLTADPVQLLQPTSGTTGGEKLIPYTAALRRQYQRGVAAWIADLFGHRPAVRRGRAYWSISPALGPPRRTPAGIPIGFDDDAAYLGQLERFALDRLLVVPPAVARLGDLETFRYCMLLCLLRAADLALISVWNPTFLTALVGRLAEWHDRLCCDLRRGTLSPPGSVAPALADRLMPWRCADPRRAAQLASIFRGTLSRGEQLRQVWPRLALISCWADAAAGRFVGEVRALFPGVEIQPKGLLATEGFVSVPLTNRAAAALAVRCHFFEFEQCASAGSGHCRLAHKLEYGGRYRVILTTGGGLYRYPLRDEVEVVGFDNQCPLLRFLGKADRVSDLVGEKLSEPHVRAVLDRLFAAHRLEPRFALLAPEDGPPRYRLYLQAAGLDGRPELLAALQTALQAGLAENPHYRYAVGLQQLAPAEIHVLDSDGEPGWQVYERVCLARGQKCGDIKPAALDSQPGWSQEFGRSAASAHR
jgi:hypothetical protein